MNILDVSEINRFATAYTGCGVVRTGNDGLLAVSIGYFGEAEYQRQLKDGFSCDL